MLKLIVLIGCYLVVTAKRPASCDLPKVQGLCEAYIPRYFYNRSADRCERFIYGGCGGNANQFKTRIECEVACGGAVGSTTARPRKNSACSLPIVAGFCKARISAYAFNGRNCVHFWYGGCLGNANRFGSMAACQKACGN